VQPLIVKQLLDNSKWLT